VLDGERKVWRVLVRKGAALARATKKEAAASLKLKDRLLSSKARGKEGRANMCPLPRVRGLEGKRVETSSRVEDCFSEGALVLEKSASDKQASKGS